jgi:3-oxoacyl-[acyl-carrier-protein] synthase-3
MNETETVGILHLSYYLPPERVELDDLGERVRLTAEQVRVYKQVRKLKYLRLSHETADDMAVKVGGGALDESGVSPDEIDAVVFFHSLYNMSLAPTSIVGRIQHELGLTRSIGFAITGQGCASVNSAIRVARNMILAGSAKTILVIGADGLQDSRARELNGITIVGDGASALILRKGCISNRLLEIGSFDEGYFHCISDWTPEDQESFDMVYVIASTRLARRTLGRAGLTLDQVRLLIPHNVNYSSWERILPLMNFDPGRFFGDNISLNGHAYGTDVVVNLKDAIEANRIQKGQYAMLMTAGLGTLGCVIIQH